MDPVTLASAVALLIAIACIALVVLLIGGVRCHVVEIVFVLDNGPHILSELDAAFIKSRFGGPSVRGIRRIAACFRDEDIIGGRAHRVGRGGAEARSTYVARCEAFGLTKVTARRRLATRDYDRRKGTDQVCVLGFVVALKLLNKRPTMGGRDAAIEMFRRIRKETPASSVYVYIAPNPGDALNREIALDRLEAVTGGSSPSLVAPLS